LISRRKVEHQMNTACLAGATQLGKAGVEEEFRAEGSEQTTKQAVGYALGVRL
jgi:hypothetical protein